MRHKRSSRETRQRQRGTQHTPTRPMQKGSRGRPPRGGAPPPSAALQELQARVAIAPLRKIPLAGPDAPLTLRFLDLFCPIGFGQRALILAPPRTGKTTFLKDLSLGLLAGAPQAVLYGLLIDERPEEITDFRRTVKAEMFASSHDRPLEEHLAVATACLERAVTEVLAHRDVVIVLDSLTRLSRAHNVHTTTGRTMSGGLDAAALELPKRLFGAARQVEHGGSLTIIATCLIDTGSRMDEVIAQEFKPHTLLVDVTLPDVSPKSISLTLRSKADLQATRLIGIAADLDNGRGESLLQDGFDAYLCKPFDIPSLIDLLKETPTPTA